MFDGSQISIDGEVSAEYDGGESRLIASGKSLEWIVREAPSAFRNLPPISRSDLARSSQLLADQDLSLTIRDASGALLELGSGRRSPVGRVMLGTFRARPRRLSRWPRLIAAQRRRSDSS